RRGPWAEPNVGRARHRGARRRRSAARGARSPRRARALPGGLLRHCGVSRPARHRSRPRGRGRLGGVHRGTAGWRLARVDHGDRHDRRYHDTAPRLHESAALMGDVMGEMLPSAVAITISPLPIVAVVLMLVTPRGRVNGVAFIVGWVIGLVTVGA